MKFQAYVAGRERVKRKRTQPAVENLWMNRAFPVDGLTAKIFSHASIRIAFHERRECGYAFVIRFACLPRAACVQFVAPRTISDRAAQL